MSNENNSNAVSSRSGKHCTLEQYEVMLQIIEIPGNFDCLCDIHASSLPTHVGAGWTIASTKSRFETWFNNFKKVFHLSGDDGAGSTGWGITPYDKRKGVRTIAAKKESACYGYMRLRALYHDREYATLPYYEEIDAASPCLFQHEPFVNDPADNYQSNYFGSDVGGSVQGAGSQGVQAFEHEYKDEILAYNDDGGDDDYDDDEEEDVEEEAGDEDEEGKEDEHQDDEGQGVDRMLKRHGTFTTAYGDQGIKRLKFEKDRIKFGKEMRATCSREP
ncbi:hypothetical protein BDC45DRAFT_537086 [Circinella umbellata]|nr:hypothetical protein BDC45DRAFT_537086 [Circinella umbellata]